MYFRLCFVIQPVSKSAGVPRGLVGWVGAAMGMGKNWIWGRRGGDLWTKSI